VSTVVHFIAHHKSDCSFYRAPQGGDLRRLRGVPGALKVRFVLPLFCFQPLYPATLSLLEFAAGKRSGIRIYELVVMPLSWPTVRSFGAWCCGAWRTARRQVST
jgi:hypothetical protein